MDLEGREEGGEEGEEPRGTVHPVYGGAAGGRAGGQGDDGGCEQIRLGVSRARCVRVCVSDGRGSHLPNFLSAPAGEQLKRASRAATRTRLQGESMALVPDENKRSHRSIHRYSCMFRTRCAKKGRWAGGAEPE